MQAQRNEACPCGSGRKYKRCCAGEGSAISSPRGASRSLLAVLFLLLLSGLGYALFKRGGRDTAAAAGTPAGKVWCENHGAWHDSGH